MVKRIKLYKMEFFKNTDTDGGAMREAIKARKHGNVVIHTQTQKNGRAWGDASPEKLLSLCEKNHGIYEVITDFPHKVYFDIDAPMTRELTKEDQQAHLESKLETISKFFPNSDYAVSGSYTPTKISYHIALNSYIIDGEHTRVAMKALVNHIAIKDKDFDWKVYTKNRNMKAINQAKDDGRVQQIIRGDDWKKHFITCFVPLHPLPFPEFTPEISEVIMQERAKGKFDVAALPKINKPTPENFVLTLATSTQLMNMLPCTKDFDHSYTHRVGRFAYFNGVTFEDFLTWIAQKHSPMTSDVANKWKTHWAGMAKYPPISKEQMYPTLFFFYPDMKKNIKLRDFYGQFHLPDTVDTITIDRLDQTHYSDKHPITILHLPMGSGKTAQTIDYLKSSPGFIWLGHRQSLHHGTISRMKDAGLSVVDYLTGTPKTKRTIYGDATNLSICINSMHYIPEDKRFHDIVIDEIESLLDSMTGDFMQKKAENLARLIHILRTAKKIILIDAFITNKTISFIKAIRHDAKIQVVAAPLTSKRIINFINTAKDTSDEKECTVDFRKIESDKYLAIDGIAKEIIAGKRVVMFYPFKKDMDAVEKTIQSLVRKATGREINSISYNADKGDEIKMTLRDVNTAWKEMDLVIFNSMITCGVNFDLAGFDSCWCLMSSINRPRDIIQSTARVRNLASETINIVFLGALINIQTYPDDTGSVNIPEYKIIYKNFGIEDMAPKRKAFEVFCAKAGYQMKKSRHLINNEICKEIDQIFNETDCTTPYNSIELISHTEAERLQNYVFAQTATMYDKLCLKKFFWYSKFFWGEQGEEPGLADIWDAGHIDWFEIYNKCSVPDSIFSAIQAQNKWESIIPPSNYKTAIIDKPTIARIFESHTFRTLFPTSNRDLIFKQILNTAFHTSIVESKGDHNTTACWRTTEEFEELKPALYALLPYYASSQ